MRLLFYGLQNSGATLLTLLAGQHESSLVIPDLWSMYCAPEPATEDDMCIKVTVTTSFTLQEHVEAFRPDHVFLVVRRPTDNYASLVRKQYARHNGAPEQKFAIVDRAFASRESIDEVLLFEDVVAEPRILTERLRELGWDLPDHATAFPRTAWEMERFLWDRAPQLYSQAQWGPGEARIQPMGSVQLNRLVSESAEAFSREHAPQLHEFYESRPHEGDPVVHHPGLVPDELALQARNNFMENGVRLVDSSLRLGQGPEALSMATELTENAPWAAKAWDALARAHERDGDFEHAAQVLQHALDAWSGDEPGRTELRAFMARQAARAGELERAAQLVAAVLNEQPGFPEALLIQAEVALRRGEHELARASAESLLTIQPRHVRGALVLANTMAAAEQLSEAIDLLQACLAIAPDSKPVQRLLTDYINAASSEESSSDRP